MKTKIVTFHTAARTWEKAAHPMAGNKLPYTYLLPYFTKSVRASNPNCELVLLTDEETPAEAEFDTVLRSKVNQDELMLDRLRLQRNFISENSESRILFVDTDTLLLVDCSEVFNLPFDVAITIRDQPKHSFEFFMPYNNGVCFVNGRRSATLDYYDELIRLNESMPQELHAWSGNQVAVMNTVGRHPSGSTVQVCGARIHILPCSTYNYTPEAVGEDTSSRAILHFRGDQSKPLMSEYFRACLAQQ